MKRLLLAAAAIGIMATPTFAQSGATTPPGGAASRLQDIPNLPPDIKRQAAALESHKDDFLTISQSLAVVDNAVICNFKNADWAATYRPIVWRMYDNITREYGISGQVKYAIHQDVETHAQKISLKLPCDKLNATMLDQFAAMLAQESK